MSVLNQEARDVLALWIQERLCSSPKPTEMMIDACECCSSGSEISINAYEAFCDQAAVISIPGETSELRAKAYEKALNWDVDDKNLLQAYAYILDVLVDDAECRKFFDEVEAAAAAEEK